MSFSISKSALLETYNGNFGCPSTKNTIPSTSFLDLSLDNARAMHEEYNKVKFGLYTGMVLEGSTEEFKKLFVDSYKRCYINADSIKESCGSTDEFVRYFGDSIKVLNTALGNMQCSCNTAVKQAKVVAAKNKAVTESADEIEDSEICPICGSCPCVCKDEDNQEHLYDYKHDNVPTLDDMHANPAKEINIVLAKDDTDDSSLESDEGKPEILTPQEKYDKLVAGLNNFYDSYRGLLCRETKFITKNNFAKALYESYRVPTTRTINGKYLKECSQVIKSYQKAVNEVSENTNIIIKGYNRAISALESVVDSIESGETVDPSGYPHKITEEESQDACTYCKAEVDKLVNMCGDHMIAIGAKLDALRSEFEQCKAIVAKYTTGIPNPEVPNVDGTDAGSSEPVVDGREPIQEDPDKSCCEARYESYLYDTELQSCIVNSLIENASDIHDQVLTSLDEGVYAAAKTVIDKIMDAVSNAMQKFTTKLKDTFDKDIAFLNDKANIDIINNKPPKKSKEPFQDWYDYNTEAFTKSFLDGMSVKDLMVDTSGKVSNIDDDIRAISSSKDAAAEKLLGDIVRNSKGETLNDKLKEYFCGQPTQKDPVSVSNSEMEDMRKFCVGFRENILNSIQNDQKAFNKIYKQATSALDKIKTADANAANDAKADKAKEEKDQQAQEQKNESFDFNKAMETYFNELSTSAAVDDGSDKKDASAAGGENPSNGAGGEQEATADDKECMKSYYANILSIASSYFGQKLTSAEKCASDYKTFLKWHIAQYAGNGDSGKAPSEEDIKKDNEADAGDHSIK